MFEDSFKNLVAAKALGLSTVFVQSDTAREEGVKDAQLETVDAVVADVSLWRRSRVGAVEGRLVRGVCAHISTAE